MLQELMPYTVLPYSYWVWSFYTKQQSLLMLLLKPTWLWWYSLYSVHIHLSPHFPWITLVVYIHLVTTNYILLWSPSKARIVKVKSASIQLQTSKVWPPKKSIYKTWILDWTMDSQLFRFWSIDFTIILLSCRFTLILDTGCTTFK